MGGQLARDRQHQDSEFPIYSISFDLSSTIYRDNATHRIYSKTSRSIANRSIDVWPSAQCVQRILYCQADNSAIHSGPTPQKDFDC